MKNIDSLLIEYRKLKNRWFDALAKDNMALCKLLDKQLKELESKINIETDTENEDYRNIVQMECQPHLQWKAFYDSLKKNGDR